MTEQNFIEPIHGKNLSEAWAKAFLRCWKAPGDTIAPAIVTFDVNLNDESWTLENQAIRDGVEDQLDALGVCSANRSYVETVAGTIFPEPIWKRCHGDRAMLFHEYDADWAFIEKCKDNLRGTYFRRLTAFGKSKVNQLEKTILMWEKGIRRRSAFQAGIFDPTTDHLPKPYLGFPCLQQVVFSPRGPNGRNGMHVVAFYAKQLHMKKAYGNYLGLFRLGKFMAGEMGLVLRGVTCIASNLKLREKAENKRSYGPLVACIENELIDE